MSKENVEKTIKEMYQNLGYPDEYTLTNLQKYAVTDDTNLWQGDFCKVYDGIANEYECIRLTIIPEIKHLWDLNIFNTKTENNPIEISKDEAIEIAKAKSISLGRDENNIKNITAELKFEKMNTFVYSQEVYEESINSISNNVSNNNDNITNIQSTDNTYGYRTENYENLKDIYKNSRSEGFGPEVKRRIILGTYVLSSGYYDAYYKKAQQVRTLVMNEFNKLFEKYDVLLTPVAPTTVFGIGEKSNNPLEMYLADICTVSINIAGVPAISIPCGVDSEGMPIGMQLIGNRFDEETILNAAYTFEQKEKFREKYKPEFKKGE